MKPLSLDKGEGTDKKVSAANGGQRGAGAHRSQKQRGYTKGATRYPNKKKTSWSNSREPKACCESCNCYATQPLICTAGSEPYD